MKKIVIETESPGGFGFSFAPGVFAVVGIPLLCGAVLAGASCDAEKQRRAQQLTPCSAPVKPTGEM